MGIFLFVFKGVFFAHNIQTLIKRADNLKKQWIVQIPNVTAFSIIYGYQP